MHIESEKPEINKPASEVFTFLSNFNNFQKLMPEQVTNWQSTEEECSFTISGMASIGLKFVEKTPNTLLKIASQGKSPFTFTLNVHITETAPDKCTSQLICEADLNPMMAMMAEKPLKKFFNFLAEKIKGI